MMRFLAQCFRARRNGSGLSLGRGCTLVDRSFLPIFSTTARGCWPYSTISHLGYYVPLGWEPPLAWLRRVSHTLNHANSQGHRCSWPAGNHRPRTGSRDMRVLRGLAIVLPITATLAIVASASMVGRAALLTDSFRKENVLCETVLIRRQENWWMSDSWRAMGIFSGLPYSVGSSVSFFASRRKTCHEPHPSPRAGNALPGRRTLVAVVSLSSGLSPAIKHWGPLLFNALSSILASATPEYSLASCGNGFNLPLS